MSIKASLVKLLVKYGPGLAKAGGAKLGVWVMKKLRPTKATLPSKTDDYVV